MKQNKLITIQFFQKGKQERSVILVKQVKIYFVIILHNEKYLKGIFQMV